MSPCVVDFSKPCHALGLTPLASKVTRLHAGKASLLGCFPMRKHTLRRQTLPSLLRTACTSHGEHSRPLSSRSSETASWLHSAGKLVNGLGMGGTAFLAANILGTGYDLQGPSSVVSALAVLAAIVTVHECGHFLAARSQKIHVTKFAIGFGPPLIRYQGPEVEYSLRAIPLGGFVAFPDDDPESPYPKDDPDLLKNRPILDRAIVISAGVIANILFAYAILLTQVTTVGVAESEYKAGVLVPEVQEGSAAYKAGMRKGDIILQVGDMVVAPGPLAVTEVVDNIRANVNHTVGVRVQRGAGQVELAVTPTRSADGGGRIGVQLAGYADIVKVVAKNPVEAVKYANREFWRLFDSVSTGLRMIVTNFSKTAEQVSGPVAIVAVGAEAVRADNTGLFQFAAILNINLAVVNVLPLPALDGGYLLLLAIELVRGGKKLPQALERGVMASGLLLITSIGMALIVHDTLNLSFFKELLQ